MTTIRFMHGDITEQEVDAIVNAANHSLLGGGGVDGAIHRRGGPEILAACRKVRDEQYPDGLPTGEAVATTAGRLKARWVIHTVGPTYAKTKDKSPLLVDCYRNSLRIADDLGAETVAFPAISAGVYRWPIDDAARIASGYRTRYRHEGPRGRLRALQPAGLRRLHRSGLAGASTRIAYARTRRACAAIASSTIRPSDSRTAPAAPGRASRTLVSAAPTPAPTPSVSPGAAPAQHAQPPSRRPLDRDRAEVPLGRMGTPDDVAQIVTYFASDAAALSPVSASPSMAATP